MGARVAEVFEFGGTDGRSNPLLFPPGKALRKRNWISTQGGFLKLRLGFTQPTLSSVDTTSAIHSAISFERYDNTRYVLYGQGSTLKQMVIGAAGTVSTVSTLSNSNPISFYFANNLLFWSNGTDSGFTNGTTNRPIGIRAPQGTESSSVTAAWNAATGSWATTSFSGYQLFMSYYNPNTGAVGNRASIGSRITVSTASGSVVVSVLPNLSAVNTEWVKIIGRTNDGGEVPYVLIDANSNYIQVGNTATVYTFTAPTIDVTQELPTRNSLPVAWSKGAWALHRAYIISDADPHYVYFSEAESDVVTGMYVGRPEQSFPANNRVLFPTGERALAVHEVDNEPWVWSRNALSIFTEYGGFSATGRPTIISRGTWTGGIAGQRAFARTNKGPFWVSYDKQLMTRGPTGPVPVSGEYESALLARIGDTQIENTELVYYRDASQQIDRLYVLGRDSSGNPLFFIHDFLVRDEGLEFVYTGITPRVFVKDPRSVNPLRDQNGRIRLWAGDSAGRFNQLEDGDHDNSATYSADLITIVNVGPETPWAHELEFQGDRNLSLTYSNNLQLTETQLDALVSVSAKEEDADNALRWKFPISTGSNQYYIVRLKLDSHHADGTLADSTTLLNVPVPEYGRLYVLRPALGVSQTDGRRRK